MEDRCVDCTARGLAASHHKFQGIQPPLKMVFNVQKVGNTLEETIKKDNRIGKGARVEILKYF